VAEQSLATWQMCRPSGPASISAGLVFTVQGANVPAKTSVLGGGVRTLAKWGVSQETLLFLVYVGGMGKSLAFTFTYVLEGYSEYMMALAKSEDSTRRGTIQPSGKFYELRLHGVLRRLMSN
jgi:hypothetical protein